MPLTPETWLDTFIVNVGNTTGHQREPQIVQLTNGNILVVWEDDTNNVDSQSGTDIIAQIFNAVGEPIGGAFHLDFARFLDDEGEFEIAARPGGGWAVAYEDTDTGGTGIVVEVFDQNAVKIGAAGVEYLEDPGDSFNDPSIAVATNGDMVVAWNATDGGGTHVHYAYFNNSTTTWSAEVQDFLASGDFFTSGLNQNVGVAAYDGGFVVTATRDFGFDNAVARLIGTNGAANGGFFSVSGTSPATGDDQEVDVVRLASGGFVITYTTYRGGFAESDQFFRVYNSSGAPITGTIGISSTGSTDQKSEASIAALTDGGFVIVWTDREFGDIRGQRYSATGVTIGSEFIIEDTPGAIETQPEAVGLADGRFAVTWQTNQGGSLDVEMKIFDTRDAINFPAVYAPAEWEIGTIGDDSYVADSSATFSHGWDGDDIIFENGQTKEYYGGEGDDYLIVNSVINTDRHDGGPGNDTIDWKTQLIFNGVFDLLAETASAGGQTEAMIGFENLIGSDGNDSILGTSGGNLLDGHLGNDTIRGRAGNDTLIGDAGGDLLDGGADIDTVSYASSNAGVTVALFNNTASGGHAAGDSFVDIENIIGSDFDDVLSGDANANVFDG
ncbi:hypothetical protein KUW09_22045, partial [Mameliella alba]|nr:hypothetical protein [Antarctobacter heliothermus]MBY6146749.1 hypothetical protein [Mameliella alba]MCA0957021.1 hypothetical protein [Mameliella alba]